MERLYMSSIGYDGKFIWVYYNYGLVEVGMAT